MSLCLAIAASLVAVPLKDNGVSAKRKLCPEGMSDNELSNHAILYRLRAYSKDQKYASCTIFLIVNISLTITL